MGELFGKWAALKNKCTELTGLVWYHNIIVYTAQRMERAKASLNNSYLALLEFWMAGLGDISTESSFINQQHTTKPFDLWYWSFNVPWTEHGENQIKRCNQEGVHSAQGWPHHLFTVALRSFVFLGKKHLCKKESWFIFQQCLNFGWSLNSRSICQAKENRWWR